MPGIVNPANGRFIARLLRGIGVIKGSGQRYARTLRVLPA
jgi:hypothetical protein